MIFSFSHFSSLFYTFQFQSHFDLKMGNAHGNRKADCVKLKVCLELAIRRLQLLQKKKTELAMKERVQVADFLKSKYFSDGSCNF